MIRVEAENVMGLKHMLRGILGHKPEEEKHPKQLLVSVHENADEVTIVLSKELKGRNIFVIYGDA